jgi:putative sterol carrier protein
VRIVTDTMPSRSLEESLESLRTRYKPGVLHREIMYYLSLGEAPGEKWTVTLTPTSCSAVPGRAGEAQCVLKMRADLFMKMVDGSYKPGALDFMTGKLKTNNIELLLQLRQAFGI